MAPQASLIETLNSAWTLVGPPPSQPTFRQRIAYRIRLLLGRLLSRQEKQARDGTILYAKFNERALLRGSMKDQFHDDEIPF